MLKSHPSKLRKLLFVSSSDYDSLLDKGVEGMLTERSEGGYFQRVISFHPLAHKTRIIPIARGHDLVECGFDMLPGGKYSRLIRYMYGPLYILIAAVKINRIVRREAVDIVRASDPYWAALVAWIGTRLTKAHFVISIHADWNLLNELDPERGAPKLFGSRKAAETLSKFLLRKAERVLCIRKSLFKAAEKAGAHSSALRLIPHGIDLEFFRNNNAGPQSVLPKRRKIIFFAGRLSRQNYVDDVIKVGFGLAARGDVVLVVAGGGPEAERLKAEVMKKSKANLDIWFLDFIPRKEVIALRKAAAVNLAPMGGYSLIEACASGRPTVAYDVQWHGELIENGKSGFLVREGDVVGLIKVIERLLDDPVEAEKIGLAGREKAFALHDFEIVWKIRSTVYQDLLEVAACR
jgi:glycosyltransferase involved in cell wall biosynthesis